jgi:hypothetical protein
MRLKLLLVTIFAAGLGASYALADDGHGDGNSQGHDNHCGELHVRGTVGPQTFTVTLTRDSKRLNLTAGSQVVVTMGGTGQTVSFNAEGCSTTSGSATQLQAKQAELHAGNTHTDESSTTVATATSTSP